MDLGLGDEQVLAKLPSSQDLLFLLYRDRKNGTNCFVETIDQALS